VIVVAGGPPPASSRPLPAAAAVVAADGGVDHALALGLSIDLAVGDFDSVTAAGLAAVEAAGARVERHPPEKDATDLELALDAAAALDPRRLLVVGVAGGRLDHLLAGLLLLAAERYGHLELDAVAGDALVNVIRGARELEGEPGELVSLLPLGGDAEGVTTEGLRYPLAGETLAAGSSRGVSNEFAAAWARLRVARGVVLAVRPGTVADDRTGSSGQPG
jgi:thiamine pyrophosphokinase